MSARWRDGIFEVDGLPNNNNPAETQKFMELLESSPKKFSYQIQSATNFNPTMSAAGYLKTAYLAAFSKFGYHYVMKRSLEKVRKQIINPNEQILPEYRLKLSGDDTTVEKILLVNKPVKSIVIQLGAVGIPLPALDSNTDDVFTNLLEAYSGNDDQLEFDEVD